MNTSKSPFVYNTHDLPRRAGEMREVRFVIDLHEPLGFDVMAIAQDEPIDIEMKLESVAEGVLVTANVLSEAIGECGRCLDEVVFDIDENFVELFEYAEDPRQARKKDKKKSQRAKDAEEAEKLDDEDELRQMDGDEVDLEGPIRDAIILNLPINPLCSPDCLGLCPDCGEKWESLPEDHAHEVIDARWAGLAGLKLPDLPSE
jgi:uncharacterized protein